MNYYISSNKVTIEGYQTISIHSNINFENDVLFFDDLALAIKYSYYFKNNKLIVKLQKKDLKRLDKLKFLICYAPNIEFTYPLDIRGELLFKQIVFVYKLINRVQKPKKLLYNVVETKFTDENIYILDGVIINKPNSTVNEIHYWTNKDEIDINYKLVKQDKKIYRNNQGDQKIFLEDYDYIMDENLELSAVNFIPRVYIYRIFVEGNYSYMDIMYQDYMHLRYKPEIITNQEIEIINNENDCKYYSNKSIDFPENFKRIKWKTTDEINFSFMYNDQKMVTYGKRKVYNNLIVNNYRIKVHGHGLSLNKISIPENLSTLEKKYYKIQSSKIEEQIYLFQDRANSADDNAEALYRYYQEHKKAITCYFILHKSSKDYNRLKAEGFNLVEFGSERHKELYLQCDKLISSHAARRIYDPFYPNHIHRNFEKFKFIFLQHGIIMGEHHGFLDHLNNKIDLFIASTAEEKKLIENFSGFECIINTGLARYDNYETSKNGDYILYAPSWNLIYEGNLQDSIYVKEIEKVINSEKIYNTLKKHNKQLQLLLHPEFINLNINFMNKYDVKILSSSDVYYRKQLSECAGLITDYSSLFFDVLYQEKVVILHQPYELHHENKSLQTFYPSVEQTDSIIDLETIIEQVANNNWKLSPVQKNNLKNIYSYRDFKNCERIFKNIEKI